MAKSKSRQQKRPPGWKGIPLTAKLWIILAMVCSALAGVLTQWPQRFPGPVPERQVVIYRTHGCKCAFAWVRQLEASGFVVTMYEPESLKTIRGALRTPPSLRGCHIGRYLKYFVEGHVPPAALSELARSHPSGIGIAAETGTDVREHSSGTTPNEAKKLPLVIYDEKGVGHSWAVRGGA